MLFAAFAFFVLGVILHYLGDISALAFFAASGTYLLTIVFKKIARYGIFYIEGNLLNVPIIVGMLMWSFGVAEGFCKLFSLFALLVYGAVIFYLVPVWVKILRTFRLEEKYSAVHASLPKDNRIMLKVLRDSTERSSFISFLRKFRKKDIRKLIEYSGSEEMFLVMLRSWIEARDYKQIRRAISAI